MPPILRPRGLRPGDLVVVTALSGGLDPGEEPLLARGVEIIERMGFRVRVSPLVAADRRRWWAAATRQDVADELNSLLGAVALVDRGLRQDWPVKCLPLTSVAVAASAFAGFRFPAEVIVVAVRWYLRYNLSYRDVEELLVERGVEVDHVTVYRWVQRFTPLLADAARFARHSPGDRWFVDETYVKVNGVWRYVYRAIDQHGQVIDVLVSARRDARRGPPVLPPGADHVEGDTDRGGHRRRPGLPARARRAGPGGVASRRTVRQQSGSRPTTASSNTGCDRCAGCEPTGPHR